MPSHKIYDLYQKLYNAYGPQGWWPFISYGGVNSFKDGNTEGYHIGDYAFPRNDLERFEVCLGSILTQNTTFTSVVNSLHNLQELNALSPKALKMLDSNLLKQAIRPSGYHNQKARYILAFIDFYESLDGCIPTRDELLSVFGIGEETADSILLYAYKQLEFKIDTYTKRILLHLGIVNEKAKYRDIKKLMEESLRASITDEKALLIVYQE